MTWGSVMGWTTVDHLNYFWQWIGRNRGKQAGVVVVGVWDSSDEQVTSYA
jgi:hypothetical protein